MLDKQRIISLIEELRTGKNIPKMEFYKLIGMTSKGYNQSWDHNSVKLETLSKVASVLGVPVSYFFASDPVTPQTHEPEENDYTVQLQEKLIACMEKKESLYESQKSLYERLVASEAEKVAILKQAARPSDNQES